MNTRSTFLDLIKNPPIKLRRVNKDEPPKKAAPAPAASSGGGDLISELTARIQRRRQAMAGEQITERRQLLNLPPTPAQPAPEANIVQTPVGAFSIPEGDSSSEEESSSSSEWDD